MMTWFRDQKVWTALAILVLVFAFFAVLFHAHPDGDGRHNDCAVCRLSQVLAWAVVCAWVFFVSRNAKPFDTPSDIPFQSLLTSEPLRARAPPFPS